MYCLHETVADNVLVRPWAHIIFAVPKIFKSGFVNILNNAFYNRVKYSKDKKEKTIILIIGTAK